MSRNPPLRVVVVDDEEPARRLLREYLSRVPEVELVAECANGFEAVKTLAEHPADLIFLDIQMPKLDGFEVLELLEGEIAVIFVTAYDEFALRAFEVNAVDYLLKPIAEERVAEALDRARARIAAAGNSRGVDIPEDSLLRQSRRARRPLERILIREGSRVHVLPVESIDYFEARDDYVFVAHGGKRLAKLQTLSELEDLLDPDRFVRIHRSFIVNVARLAKIELYAKDSRIAILTDGSHLPVSRAGYGRLRKLL